MSLKCLFGHQWNGCKCERCNAMRNEGHKWVLLEGKCSEKCSICGKERNIEHKWNGCKCEQCGAIRDEEHKWKIEKHIKKCEKCGMVEYDWDGVKQLTDQKLLMEIALSSDNTARAAVQNKSMDLNSITKVAICSKNREAAELAIMMLGSNFDLLEKIAIEGHIESISKMAYESIIGHLFNAEKALLMYSERIMKATKHGSVRERAKGICA